MTERSQRVEYDSIRSKGTACSGRAAAISKATSLPCEMCFQHNAGGMNECSQCKALTKDGKPIFDK